MYGCKPLEDTKAYTLWLKRSSRCLYISACFWEVPGSNYASPCECLPKHPCILIWRMAKYFGLSSVHSYIIPESSLILSLCGQKDKVRNFSELLTSADTPQTSTQSLILSAVIRLSNLAPKLLGVISGKTIDFLSSVLMEKAMTWVILNRRQSQNSEWLASQEASHIKKVPASHILNDAHIPRITNH